MSEFCKQTRSHANLRRLQLCTERDERTVYDPVGGCLRCRQCGDPAKHCKSCSRLVHWMESPCPGCGADAWWGKTDAPHSALAQPKSMEKVVLEFFQLLPYEAAKAAYKLAIQELHPDKGGDPAKAARFIAAWQRIKAEIFEP